MQVQRRLLCAIVTRQQHSFRHAVTGRVAPRMFLAVRDKFDPILDHREKRPRFLALKAAVAESVVNQQAEDLGSKGAFKFTRAVQLVGCSEEAYMFPSVPDDFVERRANYPDVHILHTSSDYLRTRYYGVQHLRVQINDSEGVVKDGWAVAVILKGSDNINRLAIKDLKREGPAWVSNLQLYAKQGG